MEYIVKKILFLFALILIYNALCPQDLISANDYNTPREKEIYPRFRIAVACGYSYRTAREPEGITKNDANYGKAKNGFHYLGEFDYFFNESVGIGINYNASYFNFADNYRSDKVQIRQIMPTLNARVFDKKKESAFLVSMGIGCNNYRNDYWWIEKHNSKKNINTTKDWGVGFLCSAGYDLAFSQTMAAFFQISFSGGTGISINDYTYHKQSYFRIDRDDFGKFNFSIGLRFSK